MKVFTNKMAGQEGGNYAKKVRITVDHSLSGGRIYDAEMSRKEAEDGVKWLKDHNGHAPPAAKALLDALDNIVQLRW